MKNKEILKKAAALAAAVLLGVNLVGCGAGSADGVSATAVPAESAETESADAETVTESAADAEADGVADEGPHILNWIADGEVTTMDNNKSYDTISWAELEYFNDTLYKLNSDNEAIPSLALDYPELSEDGLTATIQLREDAYFSNGENIKAQDIVYSAKRVVNPETGSQAASNINYIKNATAVASGELDVDELGISAPDDYTLVIELEAPTPYLNNNLTNVILAPVSQSFVEEAGDEYALSADKLLSSGPYILQGWEGASISWAYVKNPYYWDADNIYFDQINIQIVKEAATGISLFEAGELDGVNLTGDYVTLYKEAEGFIQVPTLRMTNLELGVNSANKVGEAGTKSSGYLTNLNIRKAINLAINRDELVNTILNGAGTPAVGAIPNGIAVSPTDGKSIAEDFGNLIEYDLDAAQEYFAKGLEELGKDAITLELYTSDDDESIRIGTYLQSELQKLDGLTIDVKNVTASVRFEVMMAYDFDLALGGWSGEYDPTSYIKQFETSYEHNHGKWVSEELTDLVNKLETEDGNDFELRWEHLREANQYIVDNVVTVDLYQGATSYLVNPGLKGIITHPLGAAVDIRYAYFE